MYDDEFGDYGNDDYDYADEDALADDDEEYLIDGVGFMDPGGRSALRAETKSNPRIFPCPQCRSENVLTSIDRQHGYVCDRCADEAEGLCWPRD